MKTKVNFSLEHKKFLKKLRNDKIVVHFTQIIILVAIIAIWEILASSELIDPFFYSSPSRILNTIVSLFSTSQIFVHMGVTLYETIIGFLISTVVGTFIASLLWWSEKFRRIMDPYLVVLNSLPKIALGPLLIIWVGAGTGAIVAMCILICIVITIISMLSAFMACDKDKILLMQSMGANKFKIFTKLILPNAIPDFLSVLKINVGMSWVGTIMGEYLVSKAGLGYLIVYGNQLFQLDLVMASIFLICVLAGLMYFLIAKLEKIYKR